MNSSKWLVISFLILSFFAKVVLIPIFLGLFMAMLLEPAVKLASRSGLSRSISSVLVVGVFGGVAVVLGWLAYTAALELVASLPLYLEKANGLMARVNQLSESLSPAVKASARAPVVQVAQPLTEWTHVLFTSLGTLYEATSIFILVPMLVFYFLVDKENLVESFNVLNGRYFNLPKLNLELPRMLRVFFAANLLSGAFLVIVQGIFFFILGYENWISLSLMTSFLNLLPIVGGGFATLAPMLLGVGVPLTLPLVFLLAAGMLALHFLANNLVMPLLVGSRLNINPVALIAGLLFWSWIWGVAGFFLAVPMTALVKILLECNSETYPLANLMASKPRRILAGHAIGLIRKVSTKENPAVAEFS